jgi:hypothetical protein
MRTDRQRPRASGVFQCLNARTVTRPRRAPKFKRVRGSRARFSEEDRWKPACLLGDIGSADETEGEAGAGKVAGAEEGWRTR